MLFRSASMLDEATAAAEAMTLASRQWKGSDDAVLLLDVNLHPHIKAVVHTRAKPLGISIVESAIDATSLGSLSGTFFGAIGAQFASSGQYQDLNALVSFAKNHEAVAIGAIDLLAATLYPSAADLGLDVAIGSAHRFEIGRAHV